MCGACKGIEGFLQGFTGLEMVLYVVYLQLYTKLVGPQYTDLTNKDL